MDTNPKLTCMECVAPALTEWTDSDASEVTLRPPADAGRGGGNCPVCSCDPSSEPASERARGSVRSPARSSRAAAVPVSHW